MSFIELCLTNSRFNSRLREEATRSCRQSCWGPGVSTHASVRRRRRSAVSEPHRGCFNSRLREEATSQGA